MPAKLEFDGSRRHVLDWVEGPEFLKTIAQWVHPQGLMVAQDSKWMPLSWREPAESRLFDGGSPFLRDEEKAALEAWWLAHARRANIHNWDLVVSATSRSGSRGLVLVEAKAHVAEFDCKPKPLGKRDTADAQRRTNENHERIGGAIREAQQALAQVHPAISISRDRCYQLSNRIALAWKLATMGVPVALVFVGFTGDDEIGTPDGYFRDDAHWQSAFASYSSAIFPPELLGQKIACGNECFAVYSKSVSVERRSRRKADRRIDRQRRSPTRREGSVDQSQKDSGGRSGF